MIAEDFYFFSGALVYFSSQNHNSNTCEVKLHEISSFVLMTEAASHVFEGIAYAFAQPTIVSIHFYPAFGHSHLHMFILLLESLFFFKSGCRICLLF